MKEFKIKKKEYKKQDIEFMRVFFDNGDYLPISKTEILEISIRLYDNLVWENRSLCPVAESGYIKLNLLKRAKSSYSDAFLYDIKNYMKDRVEYIKHRFCNEGHIRKIVLFDENHWYNTILGNIQAEMDGDNVIIRFLPNLVKKPYLSDDNKVLLNDINKSLIDKINLDFENCEMVTIYKDEIKEIKINLSEQLCWAAGDYARQIQSGYLVIKINDENNQWRENSLFDELPKTKRGSREIERRLCGKNGFCDHDLCRLYIEYEYAGFGNDREESLEIEDLRSEEYFERILKWEEENDEPFYPFFIGGYAEKQKDGSILITFGKRAKENSKMQQILKKYSV